ncbi:uncharacterized protein PHA67_001056 isoform 2-T2 [Liasis olivaceus]
MVAFVQRIYGRLCANRKARMNFVQRCRWTESVHRVDVVSLPFHAEFGVCHKVTLGKANDSSRFDGGIRPPYAGALYLGPASASEPAQRAFARAYLLLFNLLLGPNPSLPGNQYTENESRDI